MITNTLRIQFESYLHQLSVAIRDEFAKHNCKYLDFKVRVTGRPDGDLKVLFELNDDNSWSDQAAGPVKAGGLLDLVQEFLRRRQWSAVHAPLMLTQSGTTEGREEELS